MAANRLGDETSPYLRQHAANPVDWYPWGDEALATARRRDVPLFVSIGYSSCHWCHVMAHESFEDEATAAELNAGFVPVKVDREERPDVDTVYMEAVQALSGHGGWPLSVFATPDGRPFFAGTYFPPTDRHGMPSFRRVLAAVTEAWTERRDEVERQADELAGAVARRSTVPDLAGVPAGPGPARRPVAGAVAELAGRFDEAWGGFSPAPKFPQPALVELCLRHHRVTGDPDALVMAETTLRAMAAGGIYDHLGGGFARYSTDRTWTVPHFEKMLYDQAGLVRVYLHAWQLTGDPEWRQVVEETVEYVRRDLVSPAGGFCSAEDADSEGEEGRFYVWTTDELVDVLGAEAAEAAAWYGATGPPPFEGRFVLRRPPTGPLLRPAGIEAARRRLFAARASRPRPGLDDKVLTEWTAMFASALAEAAAALGRTDWAAAAVAAGEFLWSAPRRPDGRWLRSWQDGRARHLAYAADYAWLVDCFTRLAELTGRRRWLERADTAARELLRLFAGADGLLYTTGADAEALLVRPVDVLDNAVPSANAVAAGALVRLGALTGDGDLTDAGEGILAAVAPVAERHPLAVAHSLAAAELAGGGVTEVVVAGDEPGLLAAVRARFEPTAVVAWGEPTPSPLWQGRQAGRAYVCRRFVCRQPAATPEALVEQLEAERAADAAVGARA